MNSCITWLNSKSDWAVLSLRLFIGVRLAYGVMDNVFSWERMIEFSSFLRQFDFPYPLACAIISVYMQLLAGLCFILGFWTRYAAVLMILNFSTALIMVHRSDSFEGMTPALSIFFCSILFLFQGAGKLSLDSIIKSRKS